MEKIIKRFKSKKNKVFLIENDKQFYVKKIFENYNSFMNEFSELKASNAIYAPKILSATDNAKNKIICMEYLEGELFLNLFLKEKNITKITKMLCDMIKSYQKNRPNIIPNDENFRNYIIANNRCYRIDFEDIRNGTKQEWLSQLICFAILYYVEYEKIKCFAIILLSEFNIKFNDIKNITYDELTKVCKRRQISIPNNIYENLVDEIK